MTEILWDTAKAVLRGKFIAIQSYLKKHQEKYQIDKLTLHLKQLEKEGKKNKISRRKGIIKIQADINEKEMKETIVRINKTKSWFFENMNKIEKPLARLIKKKRGKTQLDKISNEKVEVSTDNEEIQRIMRDYYEQLYGNKRDNWREMYSLKFNLSRLKQEEIEFMNNPVTSTEIETVIKILPKNKST